MGKILVIAEKPSVGNDIARVLGCTEKKDGYIEGNEYIVTWAIGHLIGLKYPEEHEERFKTWEIKDLPFHFPISESLKVLPDTSRQFNTIKKLIHRNDVDSLINAGDAGREGYLIQEWIYRMAGNNKPVKVLWASSVTDEALKKAFSDLKENREFSSLLDEAEARAEGDHLLGINYSRALTLTKASGTTLSYGRCQTPLLNLVIQRDLEIENFKPEPYYQVEASYRKGFKGTLISEDKKKLDFKERIEAEKVLEECAGNEAEVVEYVTEDKSKKPPLLYDLATLQKAMGAAYGFTPDHTLSIAQSLYEKHKILSYPRTDSQYLSNDLYHEIKAHVLSCNFGIFRQFIASIDLDSLKAEKRYFNDLKVTDHHALIPTINPETEHIYSSLAPDEKKVFDAVVISLLAIFYPDYEYSITTIVNKIGNHFFLSKGNTIKKLGFKEIFKLDQEENPEEKEDKQLLPVLQVKERIAVDGLKIMDKKTTAPSRYTVSSLISLMEKYKIGTAATRAEIIKKLMNPKRAYLKLEKGKYLSTPLGRAYIKVIPDKLKAPELTMNFEEKLAMINSGQLEKEAFLKEIVTELEENIAVFSKEAGTGEKISAEAGDEGIGNCPICHKPMREGRKNFYCSGYKEGCQFVIWKTISGKTLTRAQLKQLLSKGKTGKIKGFQSRNGKSFEAALYVKEDKSIGFRF
ncbi:MAG: DNA topoisomerase III [Roseburia sp.]|nr:DNA topoisomerase III [Roseburia sp.]MCM1277963.1 DNA topoisomerase III [Robinsoniella sp.]